MLTYVGDEGIKKFKELTKETLTAKVVLNELIILLRIYKNGVRRVCTNYRVITLTSIPGKVSARVIEKRTRTVLDEGIKYSLLAHF